MRILLIYAHPSPQSYQSALHDTACRALRAAGHEVDDCDLYAEGFQPLLTRDELTHYHDAAQNRQMVAAHTDRLLHCQGLAFVYPTWWYGMPAMLKGYFDRVWVPGVAFDLVNGRTRPLLQHITKFAVLTTYGSPWWYNRLALGDPGRKMFMRGIASSVAPGAKKLWLAQYAMDRIDDAQRRRFLARVARRLSRF